MTRTKFLLASFAVVHLAACNQHPPGLSDARTKANNSLAIKTETADRDTTEAESSVRGSTPAATAESSRHSQSTIHLTQQQIDFAQIKTSAVQLSHLSQELDFSSIVQAPSDEVGIVSPQMNGVVSRVLVDVGDTVKKGQILMYVNSPDVAEAQANYYHALSKLQEVDAATKLIKTRLELSNKNQKRLEGLVEEGISAKRDVELAQEKVASTSAELVASEAAGNAAKAQLSAARVRLAALGISSPSKTPEAITTELPLYSPRSGTVVERNVIAGQGVSPIASTATPRATPAQHNSLICIADLKTVWVMLEVPQLEVSKLKIGTPVKFSSEVAPGMTFDGKITRLGENFDPNSHSVLVRTEIQNRNGLLKPGMLVIAKVHTSGSKDNGLIVDAAAVQNIDGNDFVFVARPGNHFEKTAVQRISTVGERSMVQGNLKLGDQIVSNGAFFLKTEAVKTLIGSDI